jgi:hypothetical protein
VISNTVFTNLLHTQIVLPFLKPIYFVSLSLSITIFIFHAFAGREQFVVFIQSLRKNSILIGTNAAAALPFIYLLVTKRLYLDFWLDEVISIRRHIVTTIDQALFWYPIPNNHVFTNALSGIYLQLLGAKNLLSVFENPEVLRTLYFSFGLAAVIVSAYFAYRFIGKWASLITIIVWTTSIAFLNFAAQVRGYAPSLFFVSVLLLAIWQYRQQKKPGTGVVILLFSAFLLYTIPSNLYLLAGLMIYFGLSGLIDLLRQHKLTARQWLGAFITHPAISISALIGFGCLLAVLCYLPILNKVLDNKYVEVIGLFRGTAFSLSLWEIVSAFISERWIIFGLALAGLLIALLVSKGKESRLKLAVFLALSIFLSFLVSFIRGDDPPPRTFLFAMPAFFLLTTIGLDALIEEISTRTKFTIWIRPVSLVLLFGNANIVFFGYYQEISDTTREVLVNENVDFIEYQDQRLTTSVYLDHYSVGDVIKEFTEQADPSIPVLIDGNNTRYDFALTTYLETYRIEYKTVTDMTTITEERVYFFLSYPEKSLGELRIFFPDAKCTIVTPTISVYRAVDCTFY